MASSSWGAPTTKTEAFDVSLSSNKGQAGRRGDHCLIRTLKYTHVVLSHKVKEIWSYHEVGWGGVREPENVSQSKTHLKCWVCIEIICSLWLNIITGIDFVLHGSQTTAHCSSLWVGCILIFLLYGKCDGYKFSPISHMEKTIQSSKMSKATKHLRERDTTWAVI